MGRRLETQEELMLCPGSIWRQSSRFLWELQAFLSRPSPDGTRPTRIAEGALHDSVPTNVSVNHT